MPRVTKAQLVEQLAKLQRRDKRQTNKLKKAARLRAAIEEAVEFIHPVGEDDRSRTTCQFCCGDQSRSDPHDVDHDEDCAWLELLAALADAG